MSKEKKMKLETSIIERNLPKGIGIKYELKSFEVTPHENDEIIRMVMLLKKFVDRFPKEEFLTHYYPVSEKIAIDFLYINHTEFNILILDHSFKSRKEFRTTMKNLLNIL
ncbi:MAG: hypothetical protein ACPGSD_07830 [Flavobacteriales bacterium]